MTKNTTKDSIVSMLNTLKEYYDECMREQSQLCEHAKTLRNTLEGDELATRMEYIVSSAVTKKSAAITAELNKAQEALVALNNRIFPAVTTESFRIPFEEKTDAPKGEGEERELSAAAAQAWEKLGGDLSAAAAGLQELSEKLLQSYFANKDLIGEETGAVKTLGRCCENIRNTLKEEETIIVANAQTCETYKQDVLEAIS